MKQITNKYRKTMNAIAAALDMILNDWRTENDPDRVPTVGFCLFVFEFGKPSPTNYISNSQREDTIKLLEEWLEKEKL